MTAPTPARIVPIACALAVGGIAPLAMAQADFRAVFVANNGNLEGSVSCLRVESDGSLTLVDRVITGTRASISDDEPGCNPAAISISPSGRFLLTSHASGSANDQITIIEVASDGTLAVRRELLVPNTPLDCGWLTDTLLAAIKTDLGGTNEVITYTFNTEDLTLAEADRGTAGSFTSSMAAHPNGMWLYAGDSTTNSVYAYVVAPDGTVTPNGQYPTGGAYALGIELTPDGRYLYAAGGISSGRDKVSGFVVNQSDGTLALAPGSPFISPGNSPARMTASADSAVLYVGHGTDATCRSFLIDNETGALTSTGFGFDVGLQGTLGGLAALPGLLLISDESTAIDGVRGVYSFDADTGTGGFTPITPSPVNTEGITPESVAAWDPPAGGCNGADLAEPFGQLDFSDVSAFLVAFGANDASADLAPPMGQWDFSDVLAFLDLFGSGCP